MRWPFRRSSSSQIEPEPQPAADENPDETNARPAWQNLSAMTPALGAMPTVTDTDFTRSLPTRWTTPPALSALGHDVRMDVPGGLVSGVARTVDPRDTRPADLAWRTPEITLPRAPQPVQPARPIQTLQTTQSAQSTQSAPMPQPAHTPEIAETPYPQPPGIQTRSVQTPRIQTPSAQTPSVQTPAVQIPDRQTPDHQTSQTSVSPSVGSSPLPSSPLPSPPMPIDASPDTAQARQVLHSAASSVEARNPRPVSADVTDGPAAAAPVQGVMVEPDSTMLASPQSATTSEPDPLLTPREARPGPDPLGSAPAVAPLISRNTIARNTVARSPVSQNTSSRNAISRGAAADDALPQRSPQPISQPQPTIQSAEPASIPDPPSDSADEPQSQSPTEDLQPPQSPLTPTPTADDQPVPASAGSSATAPTASPTADSPSPSPSPSLTSRIAPLISAAARFIPSAAAPINLLQAPTTPVDQPVRAAESILSTESFVSSFVGSGTPTFPQLPTITQPRPPSALNPTSQSPAVRSSPPRSPAVQSPTVHAPAAHTAAADVSAAHVPGVHTPASAHGPTQHDPAALDSLARQLYGRFSRHLAGELLIDRERSQFLTDLT